MYEVLYHPAMLAVLSIGLGIICIAIIKILTDSKIFLFIVKVIITIIVISIISYSCIFRMTLDTNIKRTVEDITPDIKLELIDDYRYTDYYYDGGKHPSEYLIVKYGGITRKFNTNTNRIIYKDITNIGADDEPMISVRNFKVITIVFIFN